MSFYWVVLCLHIILGNCSSHSVIRKQVSTGIIKKNENEKGKYGNNLSFKLLN